MLILNYLIQMGGLALGIIGAGVLLASGAIWLMRTLSFLSLER